MVLWVLTRCDLSIYFTYIHGTIVLSQKHSECSYAELSNIYVSRWHHWSHARWTDNQSRRQIFTVTTRWAFGSSCVHYFRLYFTAMIFLRTGAGCIIKALWSCEGSFHTEDFPQSLKMPYNLEMHYTMSAEVPYLRFVCRRGLNVEKKKRFCVAWQLWHLIHASLQ